MRKKRIDTLGVILEGRRLQAGVSYQHLANKIGISKQSLYGFVRNQDTIAHKTFKDLCDALSIDAFRLLPELLKRSPDQILFHELWREYDTLVAKKWKGKHPSETDPYTKLPRFTRPHKQFRKLKKPAEI